MKTAAARGDRELVFTRVFEAPRELVYQAWTDPKHIAKWWGPKGCTNSIESMDVMPGGVLRITMHGPDGVDYPDEIVYEEVARPERLVYLHGDEREPGYVRVTVTFAEDGGKTTVTIEMLFKTAAKREEMVVKRGAFEVVNQSMDRLAERLAAMGAEAAQDDREIVLTRVFEAPREVVFEAWTEPRHVREWYGPRGFTNSICEMDARPGGVLRFTMHGPDGVDYPIRIVYEEVVKPERLIYFQGEEGILGRCRVTVTFDEHGRGTRLTMRMLFPSAAEREEVVKKHNAIEGGNQTLDRLAERVALAERLTKTGSEEPSRRELTMTRMFDAPREAVFEAWTDVERLQRWWGPKGFTNPVCEFDAWPGGAMRIHMRAPDGKVYPMTGVVREIAAPERLVFSSAALDEKGDALFEILNTVTFADAGGKTQLTLHARVTMETAEAARYLVGMEMGWSLSLDRLGAEVER